MIIGFPSNISIFIFEIYHPKFGFEFPTFFWTEKSGKIRKSGSQLHLHNLLVRPTPCCRRASQPEVGCSSAATRTHARTHTRASTVDQLPHRWTQQRTHAREHGDKYVSKHLRPKIFLCLVGPLHPVAHDAFNHRRAPTAGLCVHNPARARAVW